MVLELCNSFRFLICRIGNLLVWGGVKKTRGKHCCWLLDIFWLLYFLIWRLLYILMVSWGRVLDLEWTWFGLKVSFFFIFIRFNTRHTFWSVIVAELDLSWLCKGIVFWLLWTWIRYIWRLRVNFLRRLPCENRGSKRGSRSYRSWASTRALKASSTSYRLPWSSRSWLYSCCPRHSRPLPFWCASLLSGQERVCAELNWKQVTC